MCARTPELVSLIKDYAYWLRELAQFGVALSDYTAPDQGISFKRGDVITLIEKNDKHGWYCMVCVIEIC